MFVHIVRFKSRLTAAQVLERYQARVGQYRQVPGLIQKDLTGQKLAAQAELLLDRSEAREEMVKELRAIRPRLGPGGAIARAADAVLGVLKSPGVTPQLR